MIFRSQSRRDFLAAPFIYKLAQPGYRYSFPRDHFNHPDFRTEWWYYTGNVHSGTREFGYELTFFRQAIARNLDDPSHWRVEDVYLAHLALSDIGGNRFHHTERLNRAGPGLAGASFDDRRIWNGNWETRWHGSDQTLRAYADSFSFTLELAPRKPPVIHGTNGISPKAPGHGNASHYISFTRLDTRGEITIAGTRYTVEGSSWMDHEFFSHRIAGGIQGWDWFSLQFDDAAELMLYRLRGPDGQPTPYSSGTFIDVSGKTRHLAANDFTLSPGRTWRSEATGGEYPLEWQIRVPSLDMVLETRPAMDQQELVSSHSYSPSYWEGAIRIAGSRGGSGYLEMTGYDKGVDIGGAG